jgi:hypothetical protein
MLLNLMQTLPYYYAVEKLVTFPCLQMRVQMAAMLWLVQLPASTAAVVAAVGA